MLRNYIKIAFRNLLTYRSYAVINIFGLMMGIACFLIIALYVFDELTFDSFHKNANHIYRIVEERMSESGKQSKVAAISYQLSEQAPVKLPGITDKARITVRGRSLVKSHPTDKGFQEEFWIANPRFLQVFDFKMLRGNRNTALDAPKSLVITEATAIKFFGTTDAMGKTVSIGNDTSHFTITGILENFPSRSHISFNMVTGESSISNQDYSNFVTSDWTSNSYFTYILLDKNANTKRLEQQMEQMLVSNRKKSNVPASRIMLQPLQDIHFHSGDIESASARTGIRPGGNFMYIYVFSIVAIFVLLIACINYINLTTARFANRAREIAVRKVVGADRKHIIFQFLAEAMLMTFIALALALILVKCTLPVFNDFSGKNLQLGFAMDYRIWIGIVCIAILAGLCSGIYPAFIQSGFKPFLLLKNTINFGKGSLSIRQSLVIVQFTLSIIMIVATMVVYLQLQYVNNKDMGFNKDQLVVIDINSGAVRRAAETFKTEYAKLPGVTSVCASSRVPGEWKVIRKVQVKQLNNAIDEKDMYFISADDKFLETFEINLVNGRNFSNQGNADSGAVIINETAAKLLGMADASEQLISIPSAEWGGNRSIFTTPFNARIIGIVKDFNFRSLHEPVAPLIIAYKKNPVQVLEYYTARISPVNVS